MDIDGRLDDLTLRVDIGNAGAIGSGGGGEDLGAGEGVSVL